MEAVQITDNVHRELQLLAHAWQISEGDVIRRLVESFRASAERASSAQHESLVHIHAVYREARIEAIFFPKTNQVQIVTGRQSGKTFRSPSGAAAAVISDINPRVKPNRGGWAFWCVTESGELLRSIRERA